MSSIPTAWHWHCAWRYRWNWHVYQRSVRTKSLPKTRIRQNVLRQHTHCIALEVHIYKSAMYSVSWVCHYLFWCTCIHIVASYPGFPHTFHHEMWKAWVRGYPDCKCLYQPNHLCVHNPGTQQHRRGLLLIPSRISPTLLLPWRMDSPQSHSLGPVCLRTQRKISPWTSAVTSCGPPWVSCLTSQTPHPSYIMASPTGATFLIDIVFQTTVVSQWLGSNITIYSPVMIVCASLRSIMDNLYGPLYLCWIKLVRHELILWPLHSLLIRSLVSQLD